MSSDKDKLNTLPTTPGVYLFKNAKGKVLYVGKAKLLKNRVRSYFQESAALDPAKRHMVRKIDDIETIATDTEHEALILEANLINKYQPPYNVILRDDKYYLFIKITNDNPPKVLLTRKLKNDHARYFGPYSSARTVRATLALLRRIVPFAEEKKSPRDRTLPHPLFVQSPKGEVGPSAYNLKPTPYNLKSIIRFLKGDREAIKTTLRRGMHEAARARQYERAAIFRDQLNAIERLDGPQKVYLPRRESFDTISIAHRGQSYGGQASNATTSAANIFSVREGKLLNKNTFLLRHRSTTTPQDILRQFILQYYRVAQDIPATILIPYPLTDQNELRTWINTENPPTFHVPRRGKKQHLMKLGERNAQQLLTEQEATFTQKERLKTATTQLAQALGLPAQPLTRIETYDISNIQGKLATASMIVFKEGKSEPASYRKFKLKLTGKPNDTAMLREALTRRFSNRHPDWPKPDLIIVDGGKGQLTTAVTVLDELGIAIPAAALAKREEELFVPGQAESIRLPHDADALYLLQRMRDEAHRFTISYHRLLRSRRASRSRLDDIPQIGPTTKRRLLNHFGSLKALETAPFEQLAALIGPAKAKQIQEYL